MGAYISILIYYGGIAILPIIFWKSKKNISFFMDIPFVFIAYIFGGMYFIELAEKEYSAGVGTQDLFSYILLMGTVAHLGGYVLGVYHKGYLYKKINDFLAFSCSVNLERILGFTRLLALISIALFIISFIGMGFVPALADNPFQAKFMAGIYQEAYRTFAIPYRMALSLSSVALLFLLTSFLKKANFIDAVLALLLVICLFLTLRRGAIASTIVVVLFSCFSFKTKRTFFFLLLFYFFLYCFGAAFNGVFLYIFGALEELDFASILRGVPDIVDQLFFLHNWDNHGWDYTLGTNFFGGLIPYHSKYNLAVLTLNVVGAEAGISASGGFRLPVAMIGYISFGWGGVIGISFLYSYTMGTLLRCQRKWLEECGLIQFILINAVCFRYVLSTISGFFVSGMSLDGVFIIFLMIFMLFKLKYRIVM